MLTPQEVHALLALIYRSERRANLTVDPEDVQLWHAYAQRGRWRTFSEAKEAVLDFYVRPTEKVGERRFINQADITAWFRNNAAQPPQYVRELSGPAPATAERRRALIAEWAQTVGNKKRIPDE